MSSGSASPFEGTPALEAVMQAERDFDVELPDAPGEKRDPSRDNFVDELTAEEIAAQDTKMAEEEGSLGNMVNVWRDLKPEQRAALLSSEALGRAGRAAGPRSARWINEKAVPANLHLRWMSLQVVQDGAGWRGYKPVLRNDQTQQWVPNCRQYGAHKTYMVGRSVLCAIPMREYLARVAAEFQSANVDQFDELNDDFVGAIKVLSKRMGLTKAQAARLERQGFNGFTMVKGPDPGGKADVVDADEVEEQIASRVNQKARRRRG